MNRLRQRFFPEYPFIIQTLKSHMAIKFA